MRPAMRCDISDRTLGFWMCSGFIWILMLQVTCSCCASTTLVVQGFHADRRCLCRSMTMRRWRKSMTTTGARVVHSALCVQH